MSNPFKDFFTIGESFTYLGIEMVVVCFNDAADDKDIILSSKNKYNLLVCEYVTADGIITRKHFFQNTMQSLINYLNNNR